MAEARPGPHPPGHLAWRRLATSTLAALVAALVSGGLAGCGRREPSSLPGEGLEPRGVVFLAMGIPSDERIDTELMEALMGRRPELRFKFIQENAAKLDAEEVDA